MKMKTVALVSVAMALGSLMATDYYVDANNGNDDWDGTADYEHRDESISKGPKKTLVAALAISGLGSGDVVYAAEGYYTNGVALVGTARYRVKVPANVHLVASGRAKETFIVGEEAPADATDRDSYGNGTGSMRCVNLASGAQLVGFTVTGGRTLVGTKDATCSGGAIAGTSDSYVLDCIITNNISAYRGGAIYYGSRAVRCYFAYNRALEGNGHSTQGIMAYNCVCGPSPAGYHFYQGSSYNCTFIGRSSRYGKTYNAIVLGGDGGNDVMTNCYYVANLGTGSTVDETSRKVTAADLALDENYRPVWSNVAINAGSDARYPSFPAALSSERFKDFHGAPRMVGTIDVGACEFDWRTMPTTSGLEFAIEAVEGGERLRVWRNFTSDKLVKGFSYGDETVMFEGLEGGVWETNVTGQAIANSLVPIYEANQTDWYVNPDLTKGDDTNKGYHPDCPKRTLVAAMALAKSGDVVHAAAGVYNEGQVNGNTSNRVTIPNGVGLVSDEGAENTVIEGYTPVYYDENDVKKIGGVGSMRCVSMSGTAYIKGFTLRNGATCPGLSSLYGDNGGGVTGGTAIDCVITNCYAVRGGGSASTTLIRCFMVGCGYTTGTNANGQVGNNSGHGMYGGSAYDSYIGNDSLNVVNLVNCTVSGLWVASGSFTHLYNSCVTGSGNNLTSSTNTLWGFTRDGMVLGEGSSVGTFSRDAETRRPLADATKAIDKGNVAYYTYPAAWEHEMGKDLKGGQRIYNGQIDIGCGEYDWRGVFGGKLNGKGRAQVTAASANVTTNTLDGVVLHSGDSVEVEYTVASVAAHTCTFKVAVSGEGSVTARFGDAVLVPDASGTYTFSGATGVNRVTILFEGAGSAVVSSFAGPHVGVQFVIR